MNMLLAQSASLDAAMSEGLGIIAKFLFIVAVIVIAHGGWQIRSGNADIAKMSIAGGLLLWSRSPHRRGPLQRGRNAHYQNRPVSKVVVQTHAGDDSDGKIWGIEGMNILLILAGLILSVGLSMMLFRQQAHSPFVSFGLGSLPFVLMVAYVFRLRQGKPKHYDTDLLDTFTSGTAWMPARRQPRHPLYPP
jgi:hypothetical protein